MKGLFGLFVLAGMAMAIVGWAANIVKIVGLLSGGMTAILLARCAGVVLAPLGAVLGWF